MRTPTGGQRLTMFWSTHKKARISISTVLAMAWIAICGTVFGHGTSDANAAPAPATVPSSSCRMGIGGTWVGSGCTNQYAKAGALQPTSNYRTAGKCAGAAIIGGTGGPQVASAAFATCLWISSW